MEWAGPVFAFLAIAVGACAGVVALAKLIRGMGAD